MRDFFWFAVLTITMAIVGDYNATMKTATVSLRTRGRAPLKSVAKKTSPVFLPSYALVP